MNDGRNENGTRQANILVVDDEEGIRHGLSHMFMREGFRVSTAADGRSALAILKASAFDAAVLDIRLREDSSGVTLLSRMKAIEPDLTVVMITGYGSIESAVESMKAGAADYILKPIDNERLLSAVRRHLELKALRRENDYLKTELYSNVYSFDLVTASGIMHELIRTADKIKNTPATVLLSGESGTGKEVFARYIHFTSNRKNRAFVSVNCAALSEELLLSELFGHEKGAFTGAVERKPGRFELADGGTLFLDEIGDMPPNAQAKLLRVLEERSFERVGGTRRISVDIRLITATNRDLRTLIRSGTFREDLYYRIHVISLDLPPLRERKNDIPPLVDHFIRKYDERYGKRVRSLLPDAMEAVLAYDWPGNIRELQNFVNQAVLLGEGEYVGAPIFPKTNDTGPTGTADNRELRSAGNHVRGIHAGETGDSGTEKNSVKSDGTDVRPLREAMAEATDGCERKILEDALAAFRGNRTRTAEALGITRKTLRLKMDRYGLR